jgi:hypothetical protein
MRNNQKITLKKLSQDNHRTQFKQDKNACKNNYFIL